MRRFAAFAGILVIYTYLAWQIAKRLGYTLDKPSFLVAMFVASLTGATWFLVSDWWSTATRPDRPQTVTLDTKETPNQISAAAFWAMVKLVVLVVGIAVVIAVIVRATDYSP